MTAYRAVQIFCDQNKVDNGPFCPFPSFTEYVETKADARRKAREAGWSTVRNPSRIAGRSAPLLDLCPGHTEDRKRGK